MHISCETEDAACSGAGILPFMIFFLMNGLFLMGYTSLVRRAPPWRAGSIDGGRPDQGRRG